MSYSPSLRKARMAQVVEEPFRAGVEKEYEQPFVAIRSSPPLSSPRRDHDTASAGTQASEIQPAPPPDEESPAPDDDDPHPPEFWSKGALLNVRPVSAGYCITLYPEEFDPRHPERAMTFPNSWTCQDFVSRWYARENPDPRAR